MWTHIQHKQDETSSLLGNPIVTITPSHDNVSTRTHVGFQTTHGQKLRGCAWDDVREGEMHTAIGDDQTSASFLFLPFLSDGMYNLCLVSQLQKPSNPMPAHAHAHPTRTRV